MCILGGILRRPFCKILKKIKNGCRKCRNFIPNFLKIERGEDMSETVTSTPKRLNLGVMTWCTASYCVECETRRREIAQIKWEEKQERRKATMMASQGSQ